MGVGASAFLSNPDIVNDRERSLHTSQLIKILDNRRRIMTAKFRLKNAQVAVQDLRDKLMLTKRTFSQKSSQTTQGAPRFPPLEQPQQLQGNQSKFGNKTVSRWGEFNNLPSLGNYQQQEDFHGSPLLRVSDLLLCTGAGVETDVENAIVDFLEFAQGGNRATSAVVTGACKMLSQQLDTLLLVSQGEEMEADGSITLFINNAFTRIDYTAYSYSAMGRFGNRGSISGACYVAELSVMDVSDMNIGHIDFLLSQAFHFSEQDKENEERRTGQKLTKSNTSNANLTGDHGGEIEMIMRMKLQLFESAALSRLLRKETVPLDQVREIMLMLISTVEAANYLYRGLRLADKSKTVLVNDPSKTNPWDRRPQTSYNKRVRLGIVDVASKRSLSMLSF